jgi:putative ABC transport system permease protein
MKLTIKLASSQLKRNRRRTVWTLLGIVFATAMITAVYGFIASGDVAFSRFMGENYYDNGLYRVTLISIGLFLSAIIMIASVIVISNAFRVSAGERTAQFGILKSVGAT